VRLIASSCATYVNVCKHGSAA